MMSRVKVVLCGKEYVLQTEEAPSYVYQLAKTLEKRISDITEKSPRISAHSAVMMVALSTMDELTKANASVEVIRSQVKEYVDEAGKARMERDAALRSLGGWLPLKSPRVPRINAEFRWYRGILSP